MSSSWKRYAIKQLTVPAFRATVGVRIFISLWAISFGLFLYLCRCLCLLCLCPVYARVSVLQLHCTPQVWTYDPRLQTAFG